MGHVLTTPGPYQARSAEVGVRDQRLFCLWRDCETTPKQTGLDTEKERVGFPSQSLRPMH